MKNISSSNAAGEFFPEGSKRIEYSSSVDGIKDWAIVCPGQTDVCIVKLHGHGSHGDQIFTRVDVREFWLGKLLETKATILSPNLRDNAWMCPAAVDDLSNLLDYMRNEYGIERFILSSGSMGATGNLIYATQHPEDVHAVVALGAATDLSSFYDWCMLQSYETTTNELGRAIENSYGCKPKDNPSLFDKHSALKNCDKLSMPVFFAHGEADKLIPIVQARQLAKKMQGRKNFEYHEIPDGDHDSPCFISEAVNFIFCFI